jgi:hypothetical protein
MDLESLIILSYYRFHIAKLVPNLRNHLRDLFVRANRLITLFVSTDQIGGLFCYRPLQPTKKFGSCRTSSIFAMKKSQKSGDGTEAL